MTPSAFYSKSTSPSAVPTSATTSNASTTCTTMVRCQPLTMRRSWHLRPDNYLVNKGQWRQEIDTHGVALAVEVKKLKGQQNLAPKLKQHASDWKKVDGKGTGKPKANTKINTKINTKTKTRRTIVTVGSKSATKLGRRLLQLQESLPPRRSRTRPTTGASTTWHGPSIPPPNVVWAAPASMPITLKSLLIMLQLPLRQIMRLLLTNHRTQLPS